MCFQQLKFCTKSWLSELGVKHAYFTGRKLRLREVGLFSRGFIISKARRATSLALVMAPGPVLKPWDERIRPTFICLLKNKVQIPQAILRPTPKNATSTMETECICVCTNIT